jgi:uncharacterized protein
MQQQMILREVAHRVFAAELAQAKVELKGDDERAPNFVLTPLGAKVNRVFLVGVLTECEDIGQDGREMWRGRVSDPTGLFTVYAGEYQPEAMQALSRLEVPCFVAITGKARTYEPEPGQLFLSVRPETVQEVDEATRDEWLLETAEHTHLRLRALEQVATGQAATPDALITMGIPPVVAEGAFLVKDHYGEVDTTTYRDMLLETLGLLEAGGAVPVHEAGAEPVATRTISAPDVEPGDDDEALLGFVVATVEGLLAAHPDGAPWDEIVDAAKAKKHSEEEVEEAINILIDRGVLYEPILSRLKLA